jgi:hypothetical protein
MRQKQPQACSVPAFLRRFELDKRAIDSLLVWIVSLYAMFFCSAITRLALLVRTCVAHGLRNRTIVEWKEFVTKDRSARNGKGTACLVSGI